MSLYIGIKRRRGTAANWTSVNPILLEGQWGYETDSFTLVGGIRYYKFKIGDGVTAWNSLPYSHLAPSSAAGAAAWGAITGTLTDQADLVAALATKQNSLGFTPENVSNKATDFSTVNDTKYPTVEAVAEYVATAVSGLYDDRGNYDASVNTFPASGGSGTAGAVLKGDIWTVSVAGTLGGNAVQIGDLVRALVDTPGQTSSNWAVTQNNITYVPENQANKENTTLDTSTTKYPTNRLVKEQVDLKQDVATALALGETSSTAYRGDRGATAYGYSTVGHLPLAGGNLSGAVNEATGPDVASAGTIDLSNLNAGNYYTITGSTGPITSFGTVQAGTRRILRFTGTPTITHNATSMILPNNGSDIVVEAGDSGQFVSLGSGNWVCTHYQRADGTALVSAPGGLTNFTEAVNTSAPNATIPVVSLTATNGATSVDVAWIVKANGAILAQIPDNTTTGGNKRGTNAIDFQMVRSNANQVASGNYSAILYGTGNRVTAINALAGGLNCLVTGNYGVALGATVTVSGTEAFGAGSQTTASGAYAAVFGDQTVASGDWSLANGYRCSATAAFSVVSGRSAKAYLAAGHAFASGQFAAQGDAQTQTVNARVAITGIAATELLINGGQILIPSGKVWKVNVEIVATTVTVGNGTGVVGDTYGSSFSALIKNVGGTTSIVGSVEEIETPKADTSMSTTAVAITADNSNDAIAIKLTPPSTAGTTTVTRTVATVTLTECSYN